MSPNLTSACPNIRLHSIKYMQLTKIQFTNTQLGAAAFLSKN